MQQPPKLTRSGFPHDGKAFIAWSTYLMNINNGKYRHEKDRSIAHLKYPRLDPSQYDREDNPDVTSILKLLVNIRTCACHIPYDGSYLFDWPLITQSASVYIKSFVLSTSRALYKHKFDDSLYDASVSLGYVGNTSCSNVVSVKAPGIQEPLMSLTVQVVTIDKVTRRPKKLPEWFTSKYRGKGTQETSLRVKTLSLPKETFHYQVQVLWSETDTNSHNNFSSYVQYAVNGIRYALELRKRSEAADKPEGQHSFTRKRIHCLQGLTEEILNNGLKSVMVCYTKDSKEGDILDVHLWQDHGQIYNVMCLVMSNSQSLCHIYLEYFNMLSPL